MSDWQKSYNIELVVVSNEPEADLNAFISKSGLQADYLVDKDSAVTRRYTLGALPYDCAADENGVIMMDLGLWKGQQTISDIDRWVRQN